MTSEKFLPNLSQMETEMPGGWVECQLEELLASLESGSRPKGGVRGIKEGIPSVGGEHLNDSGGFDFTNVKFIPIAFAAKMNRGKIHLHDILIVKDGATTGKTSFVDENFPYEVAMVNEHVFICRPTNHISSKYLFYFLTSPVGRQRVLDNFKGSAQGGINSGFASNTAVPLAPSSEQRRIVAKLDAVMAKVEVNKRRLNKIPLLLKRFRQSVLAAAVSGKLTEEWRVRNDDIETGPELWRRIQAERDRRYEHERKKAKKESRTCYYNRPDHLELPSKDELNYLEGVPQTWLYCKLENLCEIVRGASPRPAGDPKYFGGKIPWITVAEITKDDNVYLTSVSGFLTEMGKQNSRYINADTLMLTNSGATLGVPKITKMGGCFNDGSVAMVDIPYTSQLYLYYFLKGRTEGLRLINQGAAQPNLNTTIVKNIITPLPPLKEQEEIVLKIQQLFALADKLEERYDKAKGMIDKLPQSILAKAFRGMLVEQDPEDEPAGVLLERIRAEKLQVATQGPDRKSRNHSTKRAANIRPKSKPMA